MRPQQHIPRTTAPPDRAIRPHVDEPGTLAEQWEVMRLFWSDPTRKLDREGAWQMARRLVMEHVRRRK